MEQWYKCPRCNQDLMYGTNPCPYCKCSLAWSQQGPVLYLPPEAPQQQEVQVSIDTKIPSTAKTSPANNTSFDDNPDKVLMVAKGINGELSLLSDKIRISKKGLGAFLVQGLKGDKEIYLSQISSIQFKRSDFFTSGYIQFAFLGGQETKQGLWDAVHDENTIMFSAKQQDNFEAIKKEIDRQVSSLRTGSKITHHSRGIDDLERLAALRDKGIITEEEFFLKKRQILGL